MKLRNNVPEVHEDELFDSFVSERMELWRKYGYPNHLDSCQTSRAPVDYDFRYVFQDAAQFDHKSCLDIKKKVSFVIYFATPDLPVLQ